MKKLYIYTLLIISMMSANVKAQGYFSENMFNHLAIGVNAGTPGLGLDLAYKQLQLAKKSIEQSEENLRVNRDSYQAGTVQMSDLLDAQQQYQQSRDRYVDAYAMLQTKILEYKQSIGQ